MMCEQTRYPESDCDILRKKRCDELGSSWRVEVSDAVKADFW